MFFSVVLAHKQKNIILYACEAGTTPYMSKMESFEEATDSLLADFANVCGGCRERLCRGG
jgi:hypothetical protein